MSLVSKSRNKAIPAVYLFLEKDGKYLITRRCTTGYEDGNYQAPAGHVEDQELPSKAIIREAKEEIGIDLTEADLTLVHVSYRPRHDNTDNRVDMFFRAKSWQGDVQNCEPEKCDDLQWVAINDLPKNMTMHVRSALESAAQSNIFQEFGLNTLKSLGYYKLDE